MAETRVIQHKHESSINATEIEYMGKIAGFTKHDRLGNVEIRETLKQQPIIDKIKSRQLHLYGRLMRTKQERLVKRVVEARDNKKKKKCRPRKTQKGKIMKYDTKGGKALGDLKRLATNRKEWKRWMQEWNTLNQTRRLTGHKGIEKEEKNFDKLM